MTRSAVPSRTDTDDAGGAVVLILVSVAVLAAAVHFRRTSRIAPGSQPLPGRVVDVSVKTSSLSGSRQKLYGPSVEFQDPATGRTQVLPPASHQPREYVVGEAVTVMRDPATGEVRLPLPRPRAQMAMPFVFAALVFTLGVADLLD